MSTAPNAHSHTHRTQAAKQATTSEGKDQDEKLTYHGHKGKHCGHSGDDQVQCN